MGNEVDIAVKQLLNRGLSEERQGNPRNAITLYTKAVNLSPSCSDAVTRISRIFLAHQEFKNAINSLTYLISISKQKYYAYTNLGICYQSFGEFDKAIENFDAAIKNNPTFTIVYPTYVALLIRLKQLSKAEEVISVGLSTSEKSGDVLWSKALLEVSKKNLLIAVDYFRKAESLNINADALFKFYSDYGHACAKIKNYDLAWKLHTKAQKLAKKRFSNIQLKTSFFDETIRRAVSTTEYEKMNTRQSTIADKHLDPVFLVGFPRSGTTLMEQILHSHPKLVTTGELEVLPKKVRDLPKLLGRNVNLTPGLDELSESDVIKCRADYFATMTKLIPNYKSDLRIVDKLPLQIVFLTEIKKFFTNSPIIVMIRDPRDVCLSNYFQTFEHNAMTNQFYDIKNTVNYYAKVMGCYLHLKKHLSLNLLEVRYEDMCDNFEEYAEKIIAHIGEKWSENVLNYYTPENSRFVTTPSYEAITKPVNKSAIGIWRHYEGKLSPHMSKLTPFVEAFGYK